MELSKKRTKDKNKIMRIYKEAKIYSQVGEVEVVSGEVVVASLREHHTLDSLIKVHGSVKL